MRELNLNERVALAKLAELSHVYLTHKDLNWLSKMFDIKVGGISSSLSHMYAFQKEDVFNYITSIYTQYPDRFPKVMEEISRKIILKNFMKSLRIAESEAQRSKKPISREDLLPRVRTQENALRRYLEILGYEVWLGAIVHITGEVDIKIIKREISEERREERTKLSNSLEKHFKNEYIALNGAYERYLDGGTNANRQAIDSCRNAYENFFKKITKKGNWKDGLKDVTDSDSFIKLIKEIYNFLSGYGTHSNKEREQKDTLLAIRLTEDIMIQILTEKGLW